MIALLIALLAGGSTSPAWSTTEEEVEQAKREEAEAASRRADALADLDEAVNAVEAIWHDIEITTIRLGRIDAALTDYEVQGERIRSDALTQAAEAYIASFERDESLPSPDVAQEQLATGYVLERMTASSRSDLNLLVALRIDIERLQAELDAEQTRLEGLRMEMAAVVERLDALLAEAQAEYDAARQERIASENRFEAEQARARIFRCPVDGPVAFSDTWGAPRSEGRRHTGQDLVARTGTPLVAVKDGWIKWPTYNSIGGYTVRLRTSNGTEYLYAHMTAPTMWSEGDWVQQGTVIGYVGDTGNAYVPHLHISMWPNGGWTGPANPYELLDAACR